MNNNPNIFRKLFLENVILKLFALLMAVAIWFIALNISNPEMTETFKVPLTFDTRELERNERLLLNGDELSKMEISIKVRGRKLDLDILRSRKGEITAYIDLSLAEITGTEKLNKEIFTQVNVDLPPGIRNNYDVIETTQKTAGIIIDKYITEQKQVQINVTGQPALGYIALEPEYSPKTVEVYGPWSSVQKIRTVCADIELDYSAEDVRAVRNLRILDAYGNELTELTFSPGAADILVYINKFSSKPVYEPEYRGTPAEGYRLIGIEWEPKSIDVIGSVDDMAAFKEIRLLPIDISGLTKTLEVRYELNVFLEGTGLELSEGSVSVLTVTAVIEAEAERQFEIPAAKINVTGGTADSEYKILTDRVTFTLQGLQSTLDNSFFTEATVDITGLGEGTHRTQVIIGSLPRDTVFVGTVPTVQVVISKKGAEADSGQDGAAPEPEPEPTAVEIGEPAETETVETD